MHSVDESALAPCSANARKIGELGTVPIAGIY